MFLVMVAFGMCSSPSAETPVLSGCEVDYPPFCIVHEDGRADGFSVELMRAALAEMGREVTFRTGPWAEVRGWLERGEVDALPLVGRTPEREHLFDFTVPYMTMHGAIVLREETGDVHSVTDLRGRRVGVMQGDNAEEFLRREDRGLEILATPTFSDAFHALAEGRCDAVVVQRLVALRLLEETGLTNLKIVERPVREFAQDFCFAVKEGDSEMLSVLNEGLALAVADGTHRRLHAKWFAHIELPADRPIVVGGDHHYPPFEFLDKKGRPTGFTVELTRAIAREMNMHVRIQLAPWVDIVDGLKQGQIDAVQGIFYTPERDRTLSFSSQYLASHYVGVTRGDDGAPPETLAALAGRSVAVQAGDAILESVAQEAPDARIVALETQEDVLRAVLDGETDCGVAVRFSALHFISASGWSGLRLGKQSLFAGEYCYAVPLGNDALLAQFTEGLRTLKDTGEYHRIYEKWFAVYEEHFHWTDVLRLAALIAAPLLLVAILALLWSWSLKRQVRARTRELREQETFLRTVLDNLPVGVAVNSVESGVTFDYMNDLFAKIYRTSREALSVPDAFWHAVYGDDRFSHEMRRRVLDDCASGDPERMVWTDVPLAHEGEETTYITARNTPIHGTALMISSVWDVTERKRAESRIEHLNRVLRALREVNQLITHQTDRDALLRRSCEILVSTRGYRSAWVALRDAEGGLDAVAECGIGADFAAVRERLERGEWPECYRQALEHPDGIVPMRDTSVNCRKCALSHTYRDTAALAGRLRHAGRDYGVLVVALPVGLADDVEEQSLFRELVGDVAYALHAIEMEQARRQAEEELRKHREHLKELVEERTRELKAANKELDAFAYSVSHDLRAPLRGIDGFSMALLEDYQDQLDEEGKGYLRRVRAAAQRMGQLIDDLLALSRAIRTDMLLEDIDLGKTAQTILDELREQAPERALEAKVAPDLFVRADRRLLRTVLENLLGNAWKFTACRDTAVIELGVLDVEHGEQGPLRAYYVRDNGAGFDMTYADKLFTPFQRLHTTEEFPGTGIGLATVQRIIHRLGGRVWAEGKVDAGATVYFTVGEKARGSDSREAARSVLSRTQREDNAHA